MEQKINQVDYEATKDKEIKNIVETIDDVVQGEEPLKQDTEELFTYDNDDFFNYDEITPEDKKVIMDIIDPTIFNSNKQFFSDDEDATIEIVGQNTEIKKQNEQDEVNEGKKKYEADEVRIKNEFTNEIEKPNKKRLTCNMLGIEQKSLR